MDTILRIVDDMLDRNMHPWMDEKGHAHMCSLARRLKSALDRKNKAIDHFNDPVVSMAQTRRLVEQAKQL